MNDDVVDPIPGKAEQVHEIAHALGVFAGKEEERATDAAFGQGLENLELLDRANDEVIGLRATVDNVNRHIAVADAPKEIQQGRFTVVLVAESEGLYLIGMPIGERPVPVIQVGASPRNAQPIEPGDAELGFKAFAEAAFGLRVQVNALCHVHRYCSELKVVRSGRWKSEADRTGAEDRLFDGLRGTD